MIGNKRLQALPVWEMDFGPTRSGQHRIATDRVKWNAAHQKKQGIRTHVAKNLSPQLTAALQKTATRVYRALDLNGYARLDFGLQADDRYFVLEANANPQLAFGEDFAESAELAGLSYENLIQRILNVGLRWQPERAG